MTFTNRKQAGRQLAACLYDRLFVNSISVERDTLIVAALPRGGVPVGLEVARKFNCRLEILASKKLPLPNHPEYAIGAVSADGIMALNPDIPKDPEWQSYIESERQRLFRETKAAEAQFYELAGYKPASLKGKTVILVDDGVATGMTAVAAIRTARQRGARKVIMAAPVISPECYHHLRAYCHDVVALIVPNDLIAVGQYYADFNQTSNEEVVSALRESTTFAAHAKTQERQPNVAIH
jgi:predicted phosphoribosyltransferase